MRKIKFWVHEDTVMTIRKGVVTKVQKFYGGGFEDILDEAYSPKKDVFYTYGYNSCFSESIPPLIDKELVAFFTDRLNLNESHPNKSFQELKVMYDSDELKVF